MKRIFIALILALLIVPCVRAIGISPGYRELYFEPGLNKSFAFTMIGSPLGASVVKPYVNGSLAEYVTVPDRTYFLDVKESEGFSANMKLPEELPPGNHQIFIGILEQKTGGGQGIFARVGVESIINVRVPYPAKYIELDLQCHDTNIGDTAEFIAEVTNFGTKDLEDVSGYAEILSPDNQKLAGFAAREGSVFLSTRETSAFTAGWDTKGMNPGIYQVVFTVNYDGNSASGMCSFRVGDLKVNIKSLEVNDTAQGDIAKFRAILQSVWNAEIPQVFSEVRVYDESGIKAGSSNGETIKIGKWNERELILYWDTGSNPPGEYTAELFLDYEGRNSSSTAVFKITSPFAISWVYVIIIVLAIIVIYQVWSRRKR